TLSLHDALPICKRKCTREHFKERIERVEVAIRNHWPVEQPLILEPVVAAPGAIVRSDLAFRRIVWRTWRRFLSGREEPAIKLHRHRTTAFRGSHPALHGVAARHPIGVFIAAHVNPAPVPEVV